MANLKRIMVDSLREGTEAETVWQLRKSFLNKNLNVNDSSEMKEHIMNLSHCYVSMALGQPHSYTPDLMQEAQSRSWGLQGGVNQDLSYQSNQANVAVAPSTHYQDLNVAMSYNYNPEQITQQSPSTGIVSSFEGKYGQSKKNPVWSYGSNNQNHKSVFSNYMVNHNASSAYDPVQEDSSKSSYGQGQYGSVWSYKQTDFSLSYHQTRPQNLGTASNQHQEGSQLYDQEMSVSLQTQKNQSLSSMRAGDKQNLSSRQDQNRSTSSSLHDQDYCSSSSLRDQDGYTSSSLRNQNHYTSSSSGDQDHYPSSSSHYQDHHASSFSYRENHHRSSSSHAQNNQTLSASYSQNRHSSSPMRGGNDHTSASFHDDDNRGSYTRKQGAGSLLGAVPNDSYSQCQDTTSLLGASPTTSGSVILKRELISQTPKTQFVKQAPTIEPYRPEVPFPQLPKGREKMLDTNALSVIPAKKGRANKGFPSKKAMKKARKRERMINEAMSTKASKPFKFIVDEDTMDKSPLQVHSSCKALESSFKVQPLFNRLKRCEADSTSNPTYTPFQSSIPNKAMTSLDTSESIPKVKGINFVLARALPASASDVKQTPKGDEKQKATEVTPQNVKSHADPVPTDSDIMQKLVPILDMATCHSKLDKSTEPYTALQKCAAQSKTKVKCESKSSVNAEGVKEITCSIFANDICLVSVLVKGGTDPQSAKNKLAEAVLEKIALPHLRLVSDGSDGGLKLESSSTAFDDGNNATDATVNNNGKAAPSKETGPSTCQNNVKANQGNIKPKARKHGQIPRDPFWLQCKKPPAHPPAELFRYKDFDSYIAWRYETNPYLKKIRQLGHLFVTFPYKRRSYSQENDAAILQVLINVSGIKLEIKENERRGHPKYSVWMEDKIELFSSDEATGDPTQFISKEVLRKISLPYLCLLGGTTLKSSTTMFKEQPDFQRSPNDILDACQTDGLMTNQKYIKKRPARLENFCLYNSHKSNSYFNLQYAADINDRDLVMKTTLTTDAREKVSYFTIKNTVLGGISIHPEKYKKKAATLSAAVACFQYLRKCHWTIQRAKLMGEDKLLYPNDIIKEVETEYKALDSNDKGYQLLAKMGWSGGGVGRDGQGIVNPVQASKLLPKSSGLGYSYNSKNNTTTPGLRTDCSHLNHEELLKAYSDTKFHRDLYIRCPPDVTRNKIFMIAEDMDLKAVTRGTQRNKRVIISKNFDARMIVSDCMDLGGKSDLFELVPPVETDFEPPMELLGEVNLLKKEKIKEDWFRKSQKKRAERAERTAENRKIALELEQAKMKKAGKSGPGIDPGSSVGSVSRVNKCEVKTKSVQCNLIKAPALERVPAMELCVLEYDLDNDEVQEGGETEDSEGYGQSEIDDGEDDGEDNDDDCQMAEAFNNGDGQDENVSSIGGDRKRKLSTTANAVTNAHPEMKRKK